MDSLINKKLGSQIALGVYILNVLHEFYRVRRKITGFIGFNIFWTYVIQYVFAAILDLLITQDILSNCLKSLV